MARIRSIHPKAKRAIPQATRRAVALAAGAEPGGITTVFCAYCGAEGTAYWPNTSAGKPGGWVHFSLHLDHVIPEARGGSNSPENVVLACETCNKRKGTKDAETFRLGLA